MGKSLHKAKAGTLASIGLFAAPRRNPPACSCRGAHKSKSVHPVARKQALAAAPMALYVFGDDAPSILMGCCAAVNLTLDIVALYSPGPATYTWRLLHAESEEAKRAAAGKCTLPLPDMRRIPGLDGSDGSDGSSISGSVTARNSPMAPGTPTPKTPSRSTSSLQPLLMKTSSSTTVSPFPDQSGLAMQPCPTSAGARREPVQRSGSSPQLCVWHSRNSMHQPDGEMCCQTCLEGGHTQQHPVLLSRHARREIYEFLTKWEGYSEEYNTWEAESNLIGCGDMVREYEALKDLPTRPPDSSGMSHGKPNSGSVFADE